MKKTMLRMIAIVTLLLFLTGCACEHDWERADCENPKTCSLCGETEGRKKSHDWLDADCENPKTCDRCGKTKGDALGHIWSAADCQTASVCANCGLVDGEPIGHIWSEATCTEPAYCVSCGISDGILLEHSWTRDDYGYRVCEVCGFLDEDTEVVVTPMEIPYEPIYKLTFDDRTNLTALVQNRDSISNYEAAVYDLVPYSGHILFSNGPVGQCVYLDGNYGIRMENLVAPIDDSYTISFWINASRLADFMPTLQIGRNIGCDGYGETVAWINVTQTNFFGLGAGFPTFWNRNSSLGPDSDGDGVSNGVWPWASKMDDTVYGKKEWVMITIVATGEAYSHVDSTTGVWEPRIAAEYYLNGKLILQANESTNSYHGLSPEIFLGDGLEGYLGINYWDYTFKGYFDELYIYDEILTPGQVATLWAEGDANVVTVEPQDPPEPVETDAPVDPNAIDYVGAPDKQTMWWHDWSRSFELKDGETVTVKLNNYSSGGANWQNYDIIFANVETPGHSTPGDVPGYSEYAVIRADAYGWGDVSFTPEYMISWSDWASWLEMMKDAEVTVEISRSGGEIFIWAIMVGANGDVAYSSTTFTSTLTAQDPCWFYFTTEMCYLEILSVE